MMTSVVKKVTLKSSTSLWLGIIKPKKGLQPI